VYAGHVGIAIGAHGLRRTIPLWLLIVASQLPDWGDAAVCLAEIPVSFPGMLTHSIPAVSVLALLMAALYYATSRDGQGAAIVAVVVVSHILADYFTGIKPTWPGGPTVGLQLYRQPILDFVLEAVVLVACWLAYRRSFPLEKRSSRRVALVLAVLLIIQLGADILFITTPGVRKC
jgi:hypothetical protein